MDEVDRMKTDASKIGDKTVLDALVESLERAAAYNPDVRTAPAAVLWPDKEKQWMSLAPMLSRTLPRFLILGEYDPDRATGPAIWIKCMVAGTLPEAKTDRGAPPVIYMPGVGCRELRTAEGMDPMLQSMVELQYRGVVWRRPNGRDWAIPAFLKSPDAGLGLDVARDRETMDALKRALPRLAEASRADLGDRRLTAPAINRLLTPDPARDLLRWMNDPEGVRKRWETEKWAAFRALCAAEYGFDPRADGDLVAAEKLGKREGRWDAVWKRFEESPRRRPRLPDLLARAEPEQMELMPDNASWPRTNRMQESNLRSALAALENRPAHEAAAALNELEKTHAQRRTWVWARLGRAPLARRLAHLAAMAGVAARPLAAGSLEEMGRRWMETAWRADAAVLKALAGLTRAEDARAVIAAVRAVYLPWIRDAAARAQEMMDADGMPGSDPIEEIRDGECVVFSDGLRYDVGRMVQEALEAKGWETTLTGRWAPLPTVTATARPAVSPAAHLIAGSEQSAGFEPHVAATGKPLTSHNFTRLLEDNGVQVLKGDDVGDPAGKAWCEQGDLDHKGHDEGWKLAWRVDEEIQALVERVRTLTRAGWRRIRVVTDHGWILMPGGLPKAHMPAWLTETRWGRCAQLKPGAAPAGLIAPWRWSSQVNIALAPDVSCYRAGMEYAHGGLSLQECVTPVLTIASTGAGSRVEIEADRWRGLRCTIHVTGHAPPLIADIRTRAADPGASILVKPGEVDENGKASLLVEDDRLEGTAAFIVLVDGGGRVAAKASTTVGGIGSE